MSAVPIPTRYTQDEYLTLECETDYKSEYIDGQIIAMTGGSPQHSQIIFNIGGQLYQQLIDRPCRAFTGEMRVRVEADEVLYAYPDALIVCDEPRFDDANIGTLLNPTVIIEVLSRSTEAYDRGDKFAYYRHLPSLREYVLISQDRIRVEQFVREGEKWVVGPISREGGQVQLASVGCRLAVDRIYDKVEFSPLR